MYWRTERPRANMARRAVRGRMADSYLPDRCMRNVWFSNECWRPCGRWLSGLHVRVFTPYVLVSILSYVYRNFWPQRSRRIRCIWSWYSCPQFYTKHWSPVNICCLIGVDHRRYRRPKIGKIRTLLAWTLSLPRLIVRFGITPPCLRLPCFMKNPFHYLLHVGHDLLNGANESIKLVHPELWSVECAISGIRVFNDADHICSQEFSSYPTRVYPVEYLARK